MQDEADEFEAELRAAQAQAEAKKQKALQSNAFDDLDHQTDAFAEHPANGGSNMFDPLGLGNGQDNNQDQDQDVEQPTKKKKKKKRKNKADTAILDQPPVMVEGEADHTDPHGEFQQGKLLYYEVK